MLVVHAIHAFTEGRSARWSLPALDVAQVHLEQQVLSVLTRADRRVLEQLAEPRERALALARRGEQQDAAALMKLAGLTLSLARCSPEGRAYAKTMHYAAESYLSFRCGNHTDAYARMVAAVEATDQLSLWWPDSAYIVWRRVHLVHNLLRIEVARGATREAMELGARLVSYLSGGQSEEFLSEARAPLTAPLDARLAELFFNLVMETVSELVAGLPSNEAREALRALSRLPAFDIRRAWRGWAWLAIKTTALGDDPRRFLAAAHPFLRAGRETTPTLWYAVALDLARVGAAVEPASAPNSLVEIAAELATGPRVPACMRRP